MSGIIDNEEKERKTNQTKTHETSTLVLWYKGTCICAITTPCAPLKFRWLVLTTNAI